MGGTGRAADVDRGPLWVAAGQPPAELWEGKDAALSLESERLKALLRPLKSTERLEYSI